MASLGVRDRKSLADIAIEIELADERARRNRARAAALRDRLRRKSLDLDRRARRAIGDAVVRRFEANRNALVNAADLAVDAVAAVGDSYEDVGKTIRELLLGDDKQHEPSQAPPLDGSSDGVQAHQ